VLHERSDGQAVPLRWRMVNGMSTQPPRTPTTVTRRQKPAHPPSPSQPRPASYVDAATSFEELQPAGDDFGLGAARRHDPYYDALHWGYPAQVAWLSSRQARSLFPTRPRRHMTSLSESDALAHVLDAGQRTSRHTVDVHANLLGAVHGWKTCTTEQVAALTGRRDLRSGVSMPFASTIAAGLIELGVLSTGRRGPRLLRAAEPWSAHEQLVEELGLGQLLEVTGGEPWSPGPNTPRHNVLATELGLRCAEYLDIATVLTEEYSRLHELAGPARFDDGWTVHPRAAADLTLVRTDGLRIAIELTATRGNSLAKEIKSYAHMFSNGAPGLVVVFVIAASTEPGAPPAHLLRSTVMRLVERAVREHPGTSLSRTARRFGVISWRDWFPGPQLVSERFLSLTTFGPTEALTAPGWAPTVFLDPRHVPMDLSGPGLALGGPGSWLRVVEMAKLRGSTPHWLRGPLHPQARTELSNQMLGLEVGAGISLRGAGS
jgi:hypothetical protein